MRTVILHYHLFKNAGTSIDKILRDNFPGAWATREFSCKTEGNTSEVADWITQTPDCVAFSSHTMLGPIPKIDGLQIVPLMLLRDPIERIQSAYIFERDQRAETKGAKLAKAHDLQGYIDARLAMPGDRQCKNFQTARLASMMPGSDSELARAYAAFEMMQKAGVLGLVPAFNLAMAQLAERVAPDLPDLIIPDIRLNRAARPYKSLPSETLKQLIKENGDDLALLEHALRALCAA